MDESDGEADATAEDDEEAPLFPIDGKFRDEGDRARVMALTEIDREAELAERAEQVIRHRQDMTLRRATMQNQAAASRNKRKAAEDLDEGNKRSMRPKTAKQNAPASQKASSLNPEAALPPSSSIKAKTSSPERKRKSPEDDDASVSAKKNTKTKKTRKSAGRTVARADSSPPAPSSPQYEDRP